MKKLFILPILLMTLFLGSCKKESLQTYIVDRKDNPKFMTVDFSTNTIPLMNELDEEGQEALKSIRKMNIAFLSKKNASEAELKDEAVKIKTILKATNYKTLMRFNDKRGKGAIYYIGESDAIDEIVGFVNAEEVGVGVARVLGNDMNPATILKMLKKAKIDGSGNEFDGLRSILQGMK
ncbi:DUF4252 domain-containing protein [Tenacibaculum agarivorans]|uniref:DUF4252 domain-containing protein n=1 Tax=Tenacibaculum agarivorans TaxID=1908389 RepID=UPI00094BA1AD|nr:DUF4252 domain-containing protein [Tenacibaculum agarivorans]